MLACQHRTKTGTEERLAATCPARPIAHSRRKRRSLMERKVLVVDIGGTRVKLLMSLRDEPVFASGPRMRHLWETKRHSRELKWRVI